MKLIFCTLRDFKEDVGESVRAYGILNALLKKGHEVVLISNSDGRGAFLPGIQHYSINYIFTQKKQFQGLLALLPVFLVKLIFPKLFSSLSKSFKEVGISNEPVCFFDYLDNSIGYFAKATGLVQNYINDTHGIATIEFKNNIANAFNIKSKLLNRVKYSLAYNLDKKVFRRASGIIYASKGMQSYLENLYSLRNKPAAILRYLLDDKIFNTTPNPELIVEKKAALGFTDKDFIFFFIGTYKYTAGVEHLIQAFDKVFSKHTNCKLLLIGRGYMFERCAELAASLTSSGNIVFLDRIPYDEVGLYQQISDVTVCPDKDNPLSHFVLHVKYLDALSSGKIVINGGFRSVQEINQDEMLSLDFTPSDVNSLQQKMLYAREQYDILMEKYRPVRSYAKSHLTYISQVDNILPLFVCSC